MGLPMRWRKGAKVHNPTYRTGAQALGRFKSGGMKRKKRGGYVICSIFKTIGACIEYRRSRSASVLFPHGLGRLGRGAQHVELWTASGMQSTQHNAVGRADPTRLAGKTALLPFAMRPAGLLWDLLLRRSDHRMAVIERWTKA